MIDEIGAHVSSAGGVQNAPHRAGLLNATVLQLFTKMASRWAEPEISEETAAAFRAECNVHNIRFTAAHDSYLINLATSDDVLFQRSCDSFTKELQRCVTLGIDYVVTHPGNATGGDVPSALARNADAVAAALERVPGAKVLYEVTAGSGTALGSKFEEIAQLLERTGLRERTGVCVDTCHLWAAGYDIANSYDDVMRRFDEIVGLDRIKLFHLNDSVGGLASKRDRHAHIGKGALGDEPFRRIVNDPRFKDVPKVIETPKDDDVVAADRRNIAKLRGYRAKKSKSA